jgi:hypothetical protein
MFGRLLFVGVFVAFCYPWTVEREVEVVRPGQEEWIGCSTLPDSQCMVTLLPDQYRAKVYQKGKEEGIPVK